MRTYSAGELGRYHRLRKPQMPFRMAGTSSAHCHVKPELMIAAVAMPDTYDGMVRVRVLG